MTKSLQKNASNATSRRRLTRSQTTNDLSSVSINQDSSIQQKNRRKSPTPTGANTQDRITLGSTTKLTTDMDDQCFEISARFDGKQRNLDKKIIPSPIINREAVSDPSVSNEPNKMKIAKPLSSSHEIQQSTHKNSLILKTDQSSIASTAVSTHVPATYQDAVWPTPSPSIPSLTPAQIAHLPAKLSSIWCVDISLTAKEILNQQSIKDIDHSLR